ncbi:non-homologous end-joining factor 1-like [Asterias rubens]|uniref:non-homologous end-joining factor 1-like n=1 Tax=Asterias rubens TaxID=7604 RepID=UPI001455D859|nr:non-homologous end-joining factor 1-like [Asterias rubens]
MESGTTSSSAELEWRRQWKPDLATQVWQQIQIKKQGMLVKFIFRDDCYEILLYDMITMWSEECSKDAFMKKAKRLNPNVEAPVATLIQHLKDDLSSQNLSSKSSSRYMYKIIYSRPPDESKITLQLFSKLPGNVPFRWEFDGREASSDMYAQHLATPLLIMVSELCRQQGELQNLLTKKDAEIEDYKADGAKVSRRSLLTVPFDAKAFRNEMTQSKFFERQIQSQGKCTFDGIGQELYKEVMMKNAWLNKPEEPEHSDEDVLEDLSGDEGQSVDETGPSWANRLPPSLVANAQTVGASVGSPTKSITPKGSPRKGAPSPGRSAEEAELARRQALEKRLADEKAKRDLPVKKKKKKIF